jgi:hypothetical protein
MTDLVLCYELATTLHSGTLTSTEILNSEFSYAWRMPSDHSVTNNWGRMTNEEWTNDKGKVKVTLRPTVRLPVYLGINHPPRTYGQILLLSDSCGVVDLERPLWREDGSVVYNCCQSSGLATIFYCLRFETSLFVASYNSQGYGGGQSQSQSQSLSQSYFTTDGLPPSSSSWCLTPWDSRPEYFSQMKTCGHSSYIAFSLMRGRVCHLHLLLALVSAFVLESKPRGEVGGARGHILLSLIRDLPFCRLLVLEGLWWRIRPRSL